MRMEHKESFFQFKNPVLKESLFIVNKNFKKSDSSVKQNFSIETHATTPKDIQGNKRKATVSLSVKNFKGDKFSENIPFFMNISFESDFEWEKDGKKANEIDMLKINGAALLFSYIRPLVSQLTSLAGFKQLNLPFIDFTESVPDNMGKDSKIDTDK